ncbi:hypothetical protein HK405_004887 [Cladochytrium tenue]|nr:hypothetical protein HK405_004887 [Cladochytrium tenue]
MQSQLIDASNPDDPKEISFEKGAVLDILEKTGRWWLARYTNADGTVLHGEVPSNYLEIIEFDDGETIVYDPYDFAEDVPRLFRVRALYDYKSQAPEELNISRDQIVPVIATHEDGWWEGLTTEGGRQRKGLFPSNFVERVK